VHGWQALRVVLEHHWLYRAARRKRATPEKRGRHALGTGPFLHLLWIDDMGLQR